MTDLPTRLRTGCYSPGDVIAAADALEAATAHGHEALRRAHADIEALRAALARLRDPDEALLTDVERTMRGLGKTYGRASDMLPDVCRAIADVLEGRQPAIMARCPHGKPEFEYCVECHSEHKQGGDDA